LIDAAKIFLQRYATGFLYRRICIVSYSAVQAVEIYASNLYFIVGSDSINLCAAVPPPPEAHNDVLSSNIDHFIDR